MFLPLIALGAMGNVASFLTHIYILSILISALTLPTSGLTVGTLNVKTNLSSMYYSTFPSLLSYKNEQERQIGPSTFNLLGKRKTLSSLYTVDPLQKTG